MTFAVHGDSALLTHLGPASLRCHYLCILDTFPFTILNVIGLQEYHGPRHVPTQVREGPHWERLFMLRI